MLECFVGMQRTDDAFWLALVLWFCCTLAWVFVPKEVVVDGCYTVMMVVMIGMRMQSQVRDKIHTIEGSGGKNGKKI